MTNSSQTAGAEMTLDEALIHWEAEHQTDAEKEDTLRAIEQGFSDITAGRTDRLKILTVSFGQNTVCPLGHELPYFWHPTRPHLPSVVRDSR